MEAFLPQKIWREGRIIDRAVRTIVFPPLPLNFLVDPILDEAVAGISRIVGFVPPDMRFTRLGYGYNYKHFASSNLKLYSIRITQARRATAYRDGEFMRFLTIAPDHDAAYGKKLNGLLRRLSCLEARSVAGRARSAGTPSRAS